MHCAHLCLIYESMVEYLTWVSVLSPNIRPHVRPAIPGLSLIGEDLGVP